MGISGHWLKFGPTTVAAVALAASLAAPAMATSTTRCEAKKSRTVAESVSARVYAVTSKAGVVRVFGCFYKTDRPFLLQTAPTGPYAPDLEPQLAGRYVAYLWVRYGVGRITGTELRVFDLKAGKVRHRVARWLGTTTFRADTLVLNRLGWIAWEVTDTRYHNDPDVNDRRVYRFVGTEELLDRSSGDAAYRLEAGALTSGQRGNRIYWLGLRKQPDGSYTEEPHTALLYPTNPGFEG